MSDKIGTSASLQKGHKKAARESKEEQRQRKAQRRIERSEVGITKAIREEHGLQASLRLPRTIRAENSTSPHVPAPRPESERDRAWFGGRMQ